MNNVQILNGHLEECLFEIFAVMKDSGYKEDEINHNCIIKALKDGFLPSEICSMVQVAIHFEKANFSYYTTNKKRVVKMISICTIKKFARRFFDEGFETEELSDAIERILRIAFEHYRKNDRFHVQPGTHVDHILEKALQIAENQNIHRLEDLVYFIRDEKDALVQMIWEDQTEKAEYVC